MIGAVYRAFMRFAGWYGRLVASVAAGFMSAMALCLGGGRLAGSREWVTTVLFILAVPLWIAVSVFAYKALKPQPEQEIRVFPVAAFSGVARPGHMQPQCKTA
jgi:hypothetical protein